MPLRLMLAGALALLTGCAALPSPEMRSASTTAWAVQQGWAARLLPGTVFDIQAFVPAGLQRAERLTVYIEGDGLAWLDSQTPSFAPTPTDPLALRLAMVDAGARAVYLARPCQYTQGPAFKGCHPRYWGSQRFAPELITAMDQAVDQLKTAYAAKDLLLVGYSGGAAVAALLAARRSDVRTLVTVAGTLDTARWVQLQRLSPLEGSLNPRDVAAQLAPLPQWHFVGGKDLVMPGGVLTGFLDAQTSADRHGAPAPRVQVLPFDHRCCWAQAWPELSRGFDGPAGAAVAARP